MSRTVQGATLGGDFTVTYVEEGDLTCLLRLSIDAHPEQAELDAVVARQRFPGRKSPEMGDKLRVVIGLEPVEGSYDEPREARVGVPVSLLRRTIMLLPPGETSKELSRVVEAVDEFIADAQDPDVSSG